MSSSGRNNPKYTEKNKRAHKNGSRNNIRESVPHKQWALLCPFAVLCVSFLQQLISGQWLLH